jgi:hypothetical protein
MPVVPGLGVGLFPLLQWTVIPPLAFLCTIYKLPASIRAAVAMPALFTRISMRPKLGHGRVH